ncbi:hypothetical protein ACR79N_07670 [Sphingobacterium siyangense]|uniref:Uncharacterized protein n=1 Tax=Sphingobacterium siyangense TaxID=459529 RepID=A0A562MSF1_9SPHI|nr:MULTISPECIES: hypothetical protein [Sphingobacterium]TWI22770.1 hypothetical protein IQ31_01452 [Sphingobacterium siyangense]
MMKKIILLLLLGCGTVSTKAQELPVKSTIVRSLSSVTITCTILNIHLRPKQKRNIKLFIEKQ